MSFTCTFCGKPSDVDRPTHGGKRHYHLECAWKDKNVPDESGLTQNGKTNPQRRSGINPLTGLRESYIGSEWLMVDGVKTACAEGKGKLFYKRDIAAALGLEDETYNADTQLTEAKDRVKSSRRKYKVFPRGWKSKDPDGTKWEATVRVKWEKRLEKFEDYTPTGSDAIGADFKGFDPKLQKVVYVEAQPRQHDLTYNEYLGLVQAESEGALYVIQTRRGWWYETSANYEPVTRYRRKKRF